MLEVGYWVLAHQSWNPFKKTEYLSLTPSYLGLMPVGNRTKNVNLAHRFDSLDDASVFAASSEESWTPVLKVFKHEEAHT